MVSLEKEILHNKIPNNNKLALEIFYYQYTNNIIYKKYVDAIGCNVNEIDSITKIPFLPIHFFKTHTVICGNLDYTICFKSSGTTSTNPSKHFIKNINIYNTSYLNGFVNVFGDPSNYLILGLLPNYIEQGNSSLVYMVNGLISKSKYAQSNMYLYNHEALYENLKWAEQLQIPTILFGVTYALLAFAKNFPMVLNHTTLIETGGMKGRGAELTRSELHLRLQTAFSLKNICSEYGMTELLSQAYSKANEIFEPSTTLQVLVRDLYDPFDVRPTGKGALNIIDLSNLYSCSFIATEDQGQVFENGNFTVIGRLDNSDMRGCNLLE
jgi:hypothetical protein